MEFFEKMKRVKEEVEETLGDRKSTEDFKYSDFWDQQHWGKETEFRKKLKEFLKKAEELEEELDTYVLQHGKDKPSSPHYVKATAAAPDFFEGGGYTKYLDIDPEKFKQYQEFRETVSFVRELLAVFRFVE